MAALAVEAEGLVKTFGSTRALDGVDLQIPHGTVLGLDRECGHDVLPGVVGPEVVGPEVVGCGDRIGVVGNSETRR